ncbi:MAG: hypothetical protein N2201_00825 [candidate division WOR-3 bacterium]|nr:hypothetical protein [candidate division WOR-3 bacterium]
MKKNTTEDTEKKRMPRHKAIFLNLVYFGNLAFTVFSDFVAK